MSVSSLRRTIPEYSTSPLLDHLDCIRHGFFGRKGGVSEGIYESLNCGYSSNDEAASISENRRRVAQQFDLKTNNLYSLRQAHTNEVVRVTPSMKEQFDTKADGLVCTHADTGLGVLGADCAPVLFVDPINQVIGAAHSGWKGAMLGINEAVINSMIGLGAARERIKAAIGPAMQQAQYEVKADFVALLAKHSPLDASSYFNKREDKLYFDTPAYIYARLQAAGIQSIDRTNEDTFTQPNKYFSYRRTCQSGEADYGRQISVISLRP